MQNRLITLRETAQELGLSLPTIRKLIYSGQLRSLDVNGRPRIRRGDLDLFLKSVQRQEMQS